MRIYEDEAQRALRRVHYGQILDALPDDQARAAQCRMWAAAERNKYMRGQAQTIAAVLRSTNDQFKHLDAEARKIVGRQRWSSSKAAHDIAGDEELFCRWAIMWASGARP